MNASFLARGQSPSRIRRAIDRRGFLQLAAATSAFLILGTAALAHCWLRTRVTEEGYALSQLSTEHDKLLRDRERLRLQAAELQSPQRIGELARARLGMGPPAADQLVVLVGGKVQTPGQAAPLVASAR